MILTDETKQNYTGIGICKEGVPMHCNRVYIGDYVDGNEHGIGMYESRIINKTFPAHRYAGQFNDNKAEGIGVKLYGHGGKYCGEYKNNERYGLGYWKYSTGAIFVGEYIDHSPCGFGVLITWDKLKFIGYVEDWMAQSGKWYDQEDNEIDITELGYNKNGSKYVGEFKNGFRHGQGTTNLPNGEKYVGKYKNDKRHGQGTMIYPDGKKYVGGWRDGNRHGQGTGIYTEMKYVGEWYDDKRHGQGTLTMINGNQYVGEFKNGTVHGQGKWTDSVHNQLQYHR
jgi:hypothetical protein